MTDITSKPDVRPANPNFSSGPCAKRPGWTIEALSDALTGRSHRSKPGKAKLAEAIDLTKELLELPADYRVGIVPASDTGAVEMALWSMLGPRGVDMLAWESFGSGWVTDVKKQLKLDDVRVFEADYGQIPDLSQVDFDRDVVFTWNGTTSGVRVPNGDWIPADRAGLTFADATSAVFAQAIAWDKVDVATFSWQKVLGGEAAHGVLILSPRAVERLETYTPPWPMPKLFRMTKGAKLNDGIFKGETINTPSMIAVEDALDAMRWGKSVGGLKGMIARADANLKAVADWIATTPNYDFLVADPAIRSNTSICVKITADWFDKLSAEDQAKAAKKVVALLDAEGVAYDVGGYRDAPPGLRLWGGATVEASDMEALCPWLDWACAQAAAEFSA